jgi:hypothetical protein
MGLVVNVNHLMRLEVVIGLDGISTELSFWSDCWEFANNFKYPIRCECETIKNYVEVSKDSKIEPTLLWNRIAPLELENKHPPTPLILNHKHTTWKQGFNIFHIIKLTNSSSLKYFLFLFSILFYVLLYSSFSWILLTSISILFAFK